MELIFLILFLAVLLDFLINKYISFIVERRIMPNNNLPLSKTKTERLSTPVNS